MTDDGISIPAPRRRIIRISPAKLAAFELAERMAFRAAAKTLALDFLALLLMFGTIAALAVFAGAMMMEPPV